MGDEATSMMDDLADAWDAAEGDTDDVSTEYSGGEVHESHEQPDSGTGESGSGREGEDAEHLHEGELRSGDEPDDGTNQRGEEKQSVPVGLSPAAREKWADTPKEVQDHIRGYEQRMEQMAQKYGRDAQRAQAMDRSLQPFQQLFALNGGPQETLPGLLQTASVLQMGTAPQKAEMVANIIKQFGVDIKALDNMLVGEGVPPEMQAQTAIQQQVQQAVAPYQQALQGLQQQQQYAQQKAQQEVASEIDTFARNPQNEFYRDVRMDMADILDMASNRGINMSLEEAYNRACAMNPEISKIIQTRQGAQSVQNKRRAASSVHGTLGGEGDAGAPAGMRAAIADAWENAGRT